MLKHRHQFFHSALVVNDLSVAGAAWLAAYWLRFQWAPLVSWLEGLGYPTYSYPLNEHLTALPLVLAATFFCYRSFGLYRPRRTQSPLIEVFDTLRASLGVFLAVVTFMVFLFHQNYARMVLLPYFVLVTSGTIFARALARGVARWLRQRGHNLRRALVVGAGPVARDVAERLMANPWMGIEVVGFVDDDALENDATLPRPVLGRYGDLLDVVERHRVDQVFCAVPHDRSGELREVVEALTQHVVDVHIVPDLLAFATLNASATELDGLPIINLRESPLYGWNRVLKRTVDIVCASGLLLVFSPIMALVALAVKLESRGPLFYGQERMGLDGRTFYMYKFRSMKIDAETQSGAVWCKAEDDRRTKVGTFIRATSLDELPQFWNVLRGDMSLVGPRPERPVFIHEFKQTVPGYMLRHKIQAGITGWAQINGWRGNTSLEKRIEYDLYYIENWSLWFDLRIMLMTPFKGFINTNAY